MSKTRDESNAWGLVGFSPVLPGNELLKKQAVLLDSIVCDDLSIHVVRDGESRTARQFRDYANAVYKARVSELLWLRDAGLISPLEHFANQIGVTKDRLEMLRETSRATAAEGLRGQDPAHGLAAAYGRFMAASLRSRSLEVVSISRFNGTEQNTTAITEVIESCPRDQLYCPRNSAACSSGLHA